MTISIWRYCHFALALVASLFLLIAAVTGVILAVEPISYQAKGYAVQNLDEVSLGTAIEALKLRYDEIFSLEVESSGFIKVAVLTTEMETLNVYVDPITAAQLGEVQERPFIYSFATNLHRSLFLKSIGRFFVGLISFLLLLITLTGLLLLAKRQGGFKKLFSKVQKDYFELRYHVILSRWFFIPIVILALTGVYLSAEKFELLPDVSSKHQEISTEKESQIYGNIKEVPFFKNTKLGQVRKIEFPFSGDPEEYFQIDLKDRQVRVNQQTGQIISSAEYPFVKVASQISWVLHTGEGNVFWSIILLLASSSILFFMYSGFAMTLRRKKNIKATRAMPDKNEAEIVILVGSETGTSFDFANRLYNSLTGIGKKVYLNELNTYTTYNKAKNIIILTATYGEGESPTNARKFEAIFPKIKHKNNLSYSVIGFGSLAYPDYCKFAIQVDALLQEHTNFQPLLPLYKINSANFTDFENWVNMLDRALNVSLNIEPPKPKKSKSDKVSFEVKGRSELNVDNTFLIRLKSYQKIKFSSGDLLSIFPEGADMPRQYSIARIDNEILLSVKKHEFGKGSSYLYNLNKGDSIKATIEINPHFHFPKKIPSAILISNGTGVAPFLGMLAQQPNTTIHLFWGGKTSTSFDIYNEILKTSLSKNPNIKLYKSYSQEDNQQYVQEALSLQKDIVLKTIQKGGVIMICGSLAMQHGVLDMLEKLFSEHPEISLNELQHNGQLMMDCY